MSDSADGYPAVPSSHTNHAKTVDRVPRDRCRQCEREVTFDTDGSGGLVALDPDGGRHGAGAS